MPTTNVPGVDDVVGVADRQASGEAAASPPLSPAERRAGWVGALVAVAVFWLLATSGQPWRLFEEGPYTADFYDAQAHALLSGRLDVAPEVAGIEGFDVDGRTHLYFGLGPAVLRLPVALFGEGADGRLAVASMLVAVAVLALSSARLVGRARRAVGVAGEQPWLVGLFAAGAALATPVLFLASRGVVYHEAELWGAAAAVLGLELVLAWWLAPSTGRLVLVGVVGAFAVACRPTSGSAPLIALGLCIVVLALRRQWRTALTAAGVGLLAGISYLAVNLARFGSLASVPFADQRYSAIDAARQAALEANDGNLFGLHFAPTTLWHYLSPLPTSVGLERLFPFVGWSGRATVFGDVTFDTLDRSGSLPSAAPVACLLAVLGLWWVVRHDHGHGWRVIAAAGVLATAGTFTIGFVAHRYLVDFVPGLVVLAAPGLWVLQRWLQERDVTVRRVLAALVVIVGVLGMAGQSALAVQARYLYILPGDDDRLSFMELQYGIDDRLFGDRAPSRVVRAAGALPEPADGTVVVLDDCAGLYRADGLVWHAVEWEAGRGRRLVLSPDGATRARLGREPVTVATGAGWTLVAEPTADGGGETATLVYDGPNDITVRSDPFPVGTESLDVVADPATTQLVVRADGDVVMSLYYVTADGLTAGSGWAPGPGAAPLCASLAARLPPSG
jgi:hypothetical protein